MLLHRPAPPLDLCVASLWAAERGALPHARERCLPSGCVDIVIPLWQTHLVRYADEQDLVGWRLRGGALQGARDQPLVRGGTDVPSSVVGVHFRPGGAAVLAGVPMHELANEHVTLADLWDPAAAAELHEQLLADATLAARLRRLEHWLTRRLLSAAQPIDTAMLAAAQRFDAQPALARVAAVQAASGLPAERFIARFRAAVGLSPKRYCRVRRFQAVLAVAARGGRIDWAQVALDTGYSDQPHLVHEFRRFAGMPPRAYRPLAPDHPNHVALATPAEKSTRRLERVAAS
ncbi:MAG TPA: AraC family transcriptional regulator [Burkholderiaceae bacterium]